MDRTHPRRRVRGREAELSMIKRMVPGCRMAARSRALFSIRRMDQPSGGAEEAPERDACRWRRNSLGVSPA